MMDNQELSVESIVCYQLDANILENFYMLLSYQKINLEKLSSMTKENTDLTIVGKEKSGRKYIIDQWSKNKKNPLIINLEKTGLNCEYAALVSVLRKICRIKKHKIIIAPNVGFMASIYTFGISLSIDDESIFKSEKIIKKCLKKLAHKCTLIFVIDESLHISDQSIELIDSFIKQCKKKKSIYKFILSAKAIAENTCVYFESLTDCNLDKYETLRNLNLNPKIQLNNKVVEFIFQNVSDNISLLINIINDINNNNLDSNFDAFDANDLTKKILDESFKNYKYSELLTELLTIYAITKYYFQTIDLAFLLNQSEYVVNIIMDFALKHYLVEGEAQDYHIIFGLVKKIFGELDEISKYQIYANIVNMFSNIYPSDYYNKYIFAKLAKSSESRIYLMQYLMQKIRLNHNIDISDFERSLNKNEYLILQTYNCAFGLLSARKYDECIKTLFTLTELSGSLLYEINILKSQCLIRKIDRLEREQALSLLSYQYENRAIDENLKFRLDIRKIAAFVHTGGYKDALKLCNNVTDRLMQLYSKTNSVEYRYYLNVIYRKYSYVSEYDLSINYVKKSVAFFKDYKKNYYKAYYISLVNLFSLYIINMDLKNATKIKKEIEDLIIFKNNISFPRMEIAKNNFILYNYFSGETSVQKAVTELGKLYDETIGSADNILIASNYAVLMMLNSNLKKAKEILLKKLNSVKDEQEGTYSYRIIINLSVCEFLIDNNNRAECIKLLENVKYNQEDPHYRVRNQELIGIINLMKKIPQCNDAKEWCETYKSNILTAISSYTTYQQGLVFTTLFNWDDD